MIEEEWLADVFNLGDSAFEVEGFGKDDLKDLMADTFSEKSQAERECVKSTFCTLMLWLVLLKIRLARIALAKRRAFSLALGPN